MANNQIGKARNVTIEERGTHWQLEVRPRSAKGTLHPDETGVKAVWIKFSKTHADQVLVAAVNAFIQRPELLSESVALAVAEKLVGLVEAGRCRP